MASRKDLLKAQSFTTKRLVSSMVDRNPDDPVYPLRRTTTSTFVSIMLGVVLLAGTALIGLLRPGGSTDWRDASKVIIDFDSGVIFTYSADNGNEVLVPMRDITSARLRVAAADASGPPASVTVRSAKLMGVPQSAMMGIPDAPRQLPPASEMNPYPIKVCSTAPRSDGYRFLTVQIGQGAVPTATSTIVAEAADGAQYMILNGVAHRLMQQPGGDSPLREAIPLVSAGNSWLSSIPIGEPILPLDIPDKGQIPTSRRVNQLLVGQLAVVAGDVDNQARYYVQLTDGLARTTYLDMRAMQAADEHLGEPARITNSAAAANVSLTTPELMTSGIPDGRPEGPAGYVTLRDTAVCATYTEANADAPLISVADVTPAIPVSVATPRGNLADLVSMAQVKGALLANTNTTGNEHATFLISEGLRYGIPTGGARRAIGYSDDVQVARVSPDLIKLIPAGLPQGVELSKASVQVLR